MELFKCETDLVFDRMMLSMQILATYYKIFKAYRSRSNLTAIGTIFLGFWVAH